MIVLIAIAWALWLWQLIAGRAVWMPSLTVNRRDQPLFYWPTIAWYAIILLLGTWFFWGK